MPYFEFVWDDDETFGNVPHILAHDLTPDDVEAAMEDPVSEDTSRSSGEKLVYGYTPDGRFIVVVFEEFGDTIKVITAYEVN